MESNSSIIGNQSDINGYNSAPRQPEATSRVDIVFPSQYRRVHRQARDRLTQQAIRRSTLQRRTFFTIGGFENEQQFVSWRQRSTKSSSTGRRTLSSRTTSRSSGSRESFGGSSGRSYVMDRYISQDPNQEPHFFHCNAGLSEEVIERTFATLSLQGAREIRDLRNGIEEELDIIDDIRQP